MPGRLWVEERMSGPGAKHPGVVIRSKTRLTLAEARNLAASKAKGELVVGRVRVELG